MSRIMITLASPRGNVEQWRNDTEVITSLDSKEARSLGQKWVHGQNL